MKRYLLIAGDNYYPQGGTEDWKGCYATREEAEARITFEEIPILFMHGKRKGEVKEIYKRIHLDGYPVDWYDVVDLEGWIK